MLKYRPFLFTPIDQLACHQLTAFNGPLKHCRLKSIICFTAMTVTNVGKLRVSNSNRHLRHVGVSRHDSAIKTYAAMYMALGAQD